MKKLTFSQNVQTMTQPKPAQKTVLKKPYLIAAWPGMGNVGLTAISYLKDKLGASFLAELAPGDYFVPTGAIVNEQIVQPPEKPSNCFYYYKNEDAPHDILFFIANAQPVAHMEYAFAKKILSFAANFDIERVYTFAASPSDMHYKDRSRVFAVPNETSLLQELLEYKVHFLKDGNIAGMNGLLISVATELNLRGTVLLGEIPFFTAQIEFPNASIEILKIVSKILKQKIDLVDLEIYASKKEREIAPLADLLMKEEPPENDSDQKNEEIPEKVIPEPDAKVPESVHVIIEKMFRQAEFDDTYKSKMRLKEELDKWGLFDEYLDRFLDLFKKI